MQFDDYNMQKVWDNSSVGEKLMIKIVVLREMYHQCAMKDDDENGIIMYNLSERESEKLNRLT